MDGFIGWQNPLYLTFLFACVEPHPFPLSLSQSSLQITTQTHSVYWQEKVLVFLGNFLFNVWIASRWFLFHCWIQIFGLIVSPNKHCCRNQPSSKMVVKIRLARLGCRNHPFYRVVVSDSKTPRDGKHLEVVGFYNPLSGYSLILNVL